MKQEKLILSFVAILIGVVVTGAAFFLYQRTINKSPNNSEIVKAIHPTPSQQASFFLIVNQPQEGSVADRKTITVSGQTSPTATITVISSGDQEVIKPSSVGNFTTTIGINDGLNFIKVIAIEKNGETQTVDRTVGYSSEDF